MSKYTKTNIKHLRAHADFIETLPSISMREYARDKDGQRVKPSEVNECGAAMCAVGYMSFNPDIPKIKEGEGYYDHSIRVFGLSATYGLGLSCFGPHVPNDPKIVAASMRYVADQMEAK